MPVGFVSFVECVNEQVPRADRAATGRAWHMIVQFIDGISSAVAPYNGHGFNGQCWHKNAPKVAYCCVGQLERWPMIQWQN